MKTLGLRTLRNNSSQLTKSAANGEAVVITNRNVPISISIPFDDQFVKYGTHVSMAIKLFEEKVLPLSKAAKMADLSIEAFMERLGVLGIVAVDYPAEEIEDELAAIDE